MEAEATFLSFSDFAQKLAGALSHNPASTLHTINLSNNSLEDKGSNTHTHTLTKDETSEELFTFKFMKMKQRRRR